MTRIKSTKVQLPARFGLGLAVGCAAIFCAMSATAAPSEGDASDGKAKPAKAVAKSADQKAKSGNKAKASDKKLSDGKKADGGETKDADKAKKTRRDPTGEDHSDDAGEKRLPARVPWRGTSFSWNNTISTSILGVGQDFQSNSYESYTQTFGGLFNYFFVDTKSFRLMANVAPSFNVEMTNSDITTTQREPQFNDLPLTVTGQIPIYRHDTIPLATLMNVRARAFLPTSPVSRDQGTTMQSQLGVVLIQVLPLIPESEVFGSWVVGGSFNYFHRFAEFNTGVNGRPGLQQNASGITTLTNLTDSGTQLTGAGLPDDSLSEAAFIFFGEELGGINWQLFAAMSFRQDFLPGFEDGCTQIDTGCVDVGRLSDQNTTRHSYGFSVGLSAFPWPELGINLGYQNNGNQLGTDGERRSPFYSPGAAFTAGLSFSPDALYERVTGPARKSPFVIF